MTEVAENSKTPKTKKSIAAKEKIYRTSINMISQKGFQETKIKDICREANVSVGTFYSYFNTKEDVIKELYLTADNFFFKNVAKEIENKSFEDKLNIFTHYYAKLNVETGIDMLRVLYSPDNEWFAQTHPMQQVLVKIISDAINEKIIREDFAMADVTQFIFVALRGVCYDWCINKGSFDMEERMSKYLKMVLRGLAVQG